MKLLIRVNINIEFCFIGEGGNSREACPFPGGSKMKKHEELF